MFADAVRTDSEPDPMELNAIWIWKLITYSTNVYGVSTDVILDVILGTEQ